MTVIKIIRFRKLTSYFPFSFVQEGKETTMY